MSTWINKIPLAAALLVLAACLPAGSPSGPAAAMSRFDGPPPARMAIAAGQVVVAGPKGFCIDRDASQDQGGRSGLSVLSSCRGLGARGMGTEPAHPAVLTAAVAPAPGEFPVGPAAPDLTRFFLSPKGRAALSRSGKAETVALREAFASPDAYLMYLSDTAGFAWGPVQAEYWRALLPLGGRMVTLSVLALPEAPLGRDQGLEVLEAFIAAMRAATPVPAPMSQPVAPAPVPAPAQARRRLPPTAPVAASTSPAAQPPAPGAPPAAAPAAADPAKSAPVKPAPATPLPAAGAPAAPGTAAPAG